jgi:NhaP-type Na+/H+ or K+/H+ antiporter
VTLGFPEALAILGALLFCVSALSGWLHGTVLSISVLSVTAGVGLAAAGVVDIETGSEGLVEVIELALLLTLFADGLQVDAELLRERWREPASAIVVAMPVTLVLIALAGKALFPALTWAEAFLLGAVLAPTDPVVTSSVVSDRNVPRPVRHTLNLESGLNDGLALPFVLALVVLAGTGGQVAESIAELAGKSLGGLVLGVVLARAAAWVLPRVPNGLTDRYEGVYALAVGLLAFGVAESTIGNGLVATFVAAISFGWRRSDLPEAFTGFNENLSSILQVATFFLFGALVVTTGFDESALALGAFVLFVLLVARPVAIFLAFARSTFSRPAKLFIAWFGPKGVASMLFALFALESTAPDRTLVFDVAAFVILGSIAAHGLTDTLGARWISRQLRSAEAPARP